MHVHEDPKLQSHCCLCLSGSLRFIYLQIVKDFKLRNGAQFEIEYLMARLRSRKWHIAERHCFWDHAYSHLCFPLSIRKSSSSSCESPESWPCLWLRWCRCIGWPVTLPACDRWRLPVLSRLKAQAPYHIMSVWRLASRMDFEYRACSNRTPCSSSFVPHVLRLMRTAESDKQEESRPQPRLNHWQRESKGNDTLQRQRYKMSRSYAY